MIIPQVREQYQNDDFYFQQNGAPPHFALAVRALLDLKFPNRWIGRRGAINGHHARRFNSYGFLFLHSKR